MATAKKSQADAPSWRWGIVLLGLALVGLGAWFWSTSGAASEPPEVGDPGVKSTLHLETFVLNLSDSGQRSYLRVGIDLGLGRELGKRQDVLPIAQARDTILGVLAEARVDELETATGKAKLKDKLLHVLQERLPGLTVEKVYFTEFLIQR